MQENRTGRAFGRTLSDFGELSDVENELKCCVSRGEEYIVGDGHRPPRRDEERKIRAEFIRFLVLGGDAHTSVHEKGVQLCGAYIEGDLDLRSCKNLLPISIRRSLVCGRMIFRDAHTRTLAGC
jgi:hypothetical protein